MYSDLWNFLKVFWLIFLTIFRGYFFAFGGGYFYIRKIIMSAAVLNKTEPESLLFYLLWHSLNEIFSNVVHVAAEIKLQQTEISVTHSVYAAEYIDIPSQLQFRLERFSYKNMKSFNCDFRHNERYYSENVQPWVEQLIYTHILSLTNF